MLQIEAEFFRISRRRSTMQDAVLELRGVSKSIKGKQIVRDLDLTL